jgi:catalase
MLANVAPDLAQAVADGLGITVPPPLPRVLPRAPKPEVAASPALSLFTRPGDGTIRARRIAILVANGVDGRELETLHAGLAAAGAVPRYVGARLGPVETMDGKSLEVEITMETAPAVLWDAAVLPAGEDAIESLSSEGHAIEFIKDQYRHCKPILVLGGATALLEKASVPMELPSGEPDPGLLQIPRTGAADEALRSFVAAIARHRHFERQTDPPLV